MTTINEINKRNMFQKMWIFLLFCIVTLNLAACGKAEDTPKAEIPEEGIVIIQQYVNWAWGYQNHGSFVDIKGNVYEFDFSSHTYDQSTLLTDQQFLQELEDIYQNSQPTASVDASIVEKCYSKIANIDLNSEIISESAACDMGQNSLYVLSNNQMILLQSIGDLDKERDDATAKEIVELCNKLVVN